jgi:hypothetical protein
VTKLARLGLSLGLRLGPSWWRGSWKATLRGGAGVTSLAMADSWGATLSGGAGANGLAFSVSLSLLGSVLWRKHSVAVTECNNSEEIRLLLE